MANLSELFMLAKQRLIITYLWFLLNDCVQPNETFKAFYDTNMVVIIDDEGAPAGTRILAPLPSWLRDPKVHAKFEAYKFQDVQMNKILAICPRFV